MASPIPNQYEVVSQFEAVAPPDGPIDFPFEETSTWVKVAFYVPVIGQIASWRHQFTFPPSNKYSAPLLKEDIELQYANVLRNVASIVMTVCATIFSGFITAPLLLTGTVLLAGAIVLDVNCIMNNYNSLKHYRS